jgi:predicted  nucleic acid-binding Zn-ribbon protein
MPCPKCGFEYANLATECPKCGIIFEKYLRHQHNAQMAAAPVKAAPAAAVALPLKIVVALAVSIAGYAGVHAVLQKTGLEQPSRNAKDADAKTLAAAADENGFVALPMAGQTPNTVYVVAAENCPHEEAQRADRLAKDLSTAGVSVERSHQAHFNITDSKATERIEVMMNSPLPIVFIRDRAKSNPTLDDVMAELKTTQ